MAGKPAQAVLNVLLTICIWIPGVIHALFVVNSRNADNRNKAVIAAIKETGQPPRS